MLNHELLFAIALPLAGRKPRQVFGVWVVAAGTTAASCLKLTPVFRPSSCSGTTIGFQAGSSDNLAITVAPGATVQDDGNFALQINGNHTSVVNNGTIRTYGGNLTENAAGAISGAGSYNVVGTGTFTATGNINPGPIANVYRNWRTTDADKLQAGITATRKIVQKQPMIPALKSAVAHFGNDPQWKTVRPPLVELSSSQEETLITELRASGFTMPDLV